MQDFQLQYDLFLKKAEQKIVQTIPESNEFELYEQFRYIMSGGGKRIRPVLTMVCAGAVGADPEEATSLAAAIEILHNFTLVHDDIMDRSPIRRGRETVHIKWNEASAILLGDIMIGYAYKLLPSAKAHLRGQEIQNQLTQALIEVCEGQVLDMDSSDNPDFSIDDYFNMINKKTSSLLAASALMGAHFGIASENEIRVIETFARSLGIAFQLQDDLLDLTAEQLKFGKKIGQDIIEGKKTYIVLKAKELVETDEDINLLGKFFAEKGLDEKYICQMQDLLERSGAIKSTKSEMTNRFKTAADALSSLKDGYYKDMLVWMINKLSGREY
ncbi:MAG: polyprenyl synthetase family protein [Candidatus Kapabacteria bacterium]|nr:polyprenyl synthetase family protein [Candidatus Kapabacteria bacterium]